MGSNCNLFSQQLNVVFDGLHARTHAHWTMRIFFGICNLSSTLFYFQLSIHWYWYSPPTHTSHSHRIILSSHCQFDSQLLLHSPSTRITDLKQAFTALQKRCVQWDQFKLAGIDYVTSVVGVACACVSVCAMRIFHHPNTCISCPNSWATQHVHSNMYSSQHVLIS